MHAQALEPRSYANTPVGINFVLLGYGYTEGDVGFDATSPIQDAKVHVHAGLVAYARSLDVWGLSGKFVAALPVAEASGSAKVAGQGRDRQVFGLADPLLRVSVNVYGAPALSMAEFPTYQQDIIVGVSLQVTAPLGQYDSTKLLNVGTNRWSFKPELGVSKAWGPLTLELIPAITFFTSNTDFFGGKTLEQAPIYSVQGHLIYEFFPAFWAALDATYYAGGRTTIDGEKGQQLEKRACGRDGGAIVEPPPVDKALWQHRRLQPHRQRLLGRRHRLPIPLGWRAVANTPCSRQKCRNALDKPERGQRADRVGRGWPGVACHAVGNRNSSAMASDVSTAAMKTSCPISTPTLNVNNASGMSPRGRPISESAPAKPKPCRRPNENATSQGHRAVRLGWPARERAISQASRRMLSAMAASTGGPGTCTTPSVASASVIECASVNAVTVVTSIRRFGDDQDEREARTAGGRSRTGCDRCRA